MMPIKPAWNWGSWPVWDVWEIFWYKVKTCSVPSSQGLHSNVWVAPSYNYIQQQSGGGRRTCKDAAFGCVKTVLAPESEVSTSTMSCHEGSACTRIGAVEKQVSDNCVSGVPEHSERRSGRLPKGVHDAKGHSKRIPSAQGGNIKGSLPFWILIRC